MQTDAEMEDWSSDTWHAFAPITAMPVALVYCALNLLGAGVVRGAIALVTHWATSRTHREQQPHCGGRVIRYVIHTPRTLASLLVLGMNVLPFTSRARAVLDAALNEAAAHRSEHVGAEHLLVALSRSGSPAAVTVHPDLSSACSTIHEIVARAMVHGTGDGTRSLPQTRAARESIIAAINQANSLEHRAVNSEHLFLGLLEMKSEPFIDLLVSDENVDVDRLRSNLTIASQLDQRTGP